MNNNKDDDNKNDLVNHPKHYNQGNIECIQAIESALGFDGFRDFLRGQVLKYIWRGPHKGNIEDYKKAMWYLDYLIRICDNQVK